VILRRASIAPVILGIAFRSSFGVRKRCVFLKEFLKENYDRLWNIFESLKR
jgi:hypothetical protein